jgi:hypothetical protein
MPRRYMNKLFVRSLVARIVLRNRHRAAERICGEAHRFQSAGIALDHIVVFGDRHLRHLLKSYQKYYNEARTHLSLHKDAPIPRVAQTVVRMLPVRILGGLHHQYIRV